ncbi:MULTISPECIES: methyltransferase domain-containing protein [unclassified Nostoc]|uniref:methyltransferase domain-containing protein n=1 Tax=unclassified Nostoc TaxID=2593658 RepID=UPI00262484AE|nr:methyltransferase domain-containing protein [Nostoc sp. S13]MDF5735826.1 methyltransferase domain-containing protein [Nostoc sp. S13]
MFPENVEKVLSKINANDLVLDVGGWACPFNRANWVIDAGCYETRGCYEKIGMPKSQGGEKEYFNKETWVQRDFCDREPWPFEDKFFDFSICSHTLEDIRDPLYVCSELIRVSKRGYIEVPSRLIESCRGLESDNMVGLCHHRWLVDITDHHVQFTMKYHIIHSDFELSFPQSFLKKITPDKRILFIFWEKEFSFSENRIDDSENIYQELRQFINTKYKYPQYRFFSQHLQKEASRIVKGIKRRLVI